MKLTRRAMIKDGLLVVSAGMIMPAIFSRGVASAQAQALDGSRLAQSANDRTLIVVQMAGGNDGLNTVVPFTDPLYLKLRPTLGLSDTKVLPLDTRLGLHPNLAAAEKTLGCWTPGNRRGGWLSEPESFTLSSDGYLANTGPEWQWQPGMAR